jgi:hypothetical protein
MTTSSIGRQPCASRAAGFGLAAGLSHPGKGQKQKMIEPAHGPGGYQGWCFRAMPILTEVLAALGIVVILVVARRCVSDPSASRLPAGTTQAG